MPDMEITTSRTIRKYMSIEGSEADFKELLADLMTWKPSSPSSTWLKFMQELQDLVEDD